jgi:peptidyl-prolyl cis-trans isomerase C
MRRHFSRATCAIAVCLATLVAACASAPQVTDEEVRAEYDRVVASVWSGNEYQVRHILLERQDQAQAALQRIQSGEPFAQVAAAVSTDPGSRVRGGELGWNIPEHFVPEFSRAMVALAPKGLKAEPVKTQFGWHVVEVTSIRKAVPPPFEQLKGGIAERLRQSKAQSKATR